MAARHWLDDGTGTMVEITDRVDRMKDWTLAENAEEGSTAMQSITLADPGMDFDTSGHRLYVVTEDTSEATDDVLFAGYTADQEISRGEDDTLEVFGRSWTVTVNDTNAFWQRRLEIGSDCNRPAETDVERMQWLVATTEANLIDDDTSFVSTATPVDMDACDYRGQYISQVVDDCAQASGNNWYLMRRETGAGQEIAVWYGRDTLAAYDSDLYLSNDPTDWVDDDLADGTSLVWPISMDTKLRRDPSRVYDGAYVQYEGGAVYRAASPRTVRRDFIAPSLNVKSSAKAIARAVRYLSELDEQDNVVTTSVELPAAKATMLRAGMRVPFKATHLPGCTAWAWWRVLSCSITPIAAGDRYRLTLELTPTGVTTGATPVTPAPYAVGVLAGFDGSWPQGSFWEATLEADGVEVLSAAELSAGMGSLIVFDTPVSAHAWSLKLTVNWTTVFMPGSRFLYALLISEDDVDLFGNGWTPGATTIAGRTSSATRTFDGAGPVDGFAMYGYLDGTLVEAYGSITLNQVSPNWFGVNQTDIPNNTVRTLVYTWTWTI